MDLLQIKGKYDIQIVKLRDIADKVTQKNSAYLVSETFTNSAEKGIISQEDYFERTITNDKNISGYYIVNPDDFVYNPRVSTLAPVGPINRNKLGRTGVISPLYLVFRVHNVEPGYLEWYFKSNAWHNFMLENGNTGARSDRFSISDTEFFSMPIPLPPMDVQKIIANTLDTLEIKINYAKVEAEKLRNFKSSMLTKMFPKEGEKVPEIRFEGFTGDWEQRKLGDIGIAKSGVGFPDVEQGGSKGTPFFKVSDMNTDGNENELVIANNYVTDEQISRKRWNVVTDVPAIFFAKVGAAVMLNRKRLVRFPFLLDNNTMAYIFDKEVWDCDFGKTLFETIDLTKLTQLGALPSYNSSDVEEIEIYIPLKVEQKCIGSYFKQLDNLITLHQRKYEKLLDVKKGLLRKLIGGAN